MPIDLDDALNRAADALRLYEQSSKTRLNAWADISAAQRRKWRYKAAIVIQAYQSKSGSSAAGKGAGL